MLVKMTRVILVSQLFNCLLLSQTLYVPNGINGIGTSTTGNVGIGIMNPNSKLYVYSNQSISFPIIATFNWHGTTGSPHFQLINSSTNKICLQMWGTDNSGGAKFNNMVFNGETLNYSFGGDATSYSFAGDVGINITSPAYALDVVGTIHTDGLIKADEIQVTENGADFVFEPDYDLPTLEEVETHINKHKHLPDIPSAEEMQANGVNMGEMQTKLLQKIEELTLYVIDLKKENQTIINENNQLKERVAALENNN